jgi:hypothetical protein
MDNNEVMCWGSNKYEQLNRAQKIQISSLPALNGIILDENDIIIPASYCTFFLTKKSLPT